MAYNITLDIDHYEIVADDVKVTQYTGDIIENQKMIVPVLSAEPTYTQASGGGSLVFTGNVMPQIPIFCFGTDELHVSTDFYKVLGHRVGVFGSRFDFTSPGNTYIQGKQKLVMFKGSTSGTLSSWSIYMYADTSGNKQIPHLTNDVVFSTSYGIDYISNVHAYFDADDTGLICRYGSTYYSIAFTVTTKSGGELSLEVRDMPQKAAYPQYNFTIDGHQVNKNCAVPFLYSGTEYKPGEGGDPGQAGGQTESNPGGLFFGGSSAGAGQGGIGGDGKTWELDGKTTTSPVPDGLNDFKLQPTIGGNGTFKSIHKGEKEDGFLPANTVDISGSNFLHIYDMTGSMGLLLQKIWTQDAQEALKQYFAGDIGNCILSVYHTRKLGINKASRSVTLGQYDTGISATEIRQYAKHKVCTFTLNSFYGSQWDYETQCYIYLPYVGFQELSMDKYMPRKTSDKNINSDCKVEVWECLDFLSGSILYFLKRVEGDFSCVLDTFSGSFKSDIPITTAQHSSMISGLISQYGGISSQAIGWAGLVSSIAATIATGGGASAASIPAMAQSAAMITGGVAAQMSGTQAACRSTFKTTGGVGGGIGAMGGQRVFITYMRPAVYQTYGKSHYIGYLSKQRVTIKNLPKGKYFKFSTAMLKGAIPAEMQGRILKQLQAGVYI